MQTLGVYNNNNNKEDIKYFYCLVGNIPITFHSADLRNYFATFVKESKFDCFHFRHRPQFITNVKSTTTIPQQTEERQEEESDKNISRNERIEESSTTKKTFCALVRFTNEETVNHFIKLYHGKYWMDKLGNELNGQCIIQKVKLNEDEIVKFAKELRPPKFMPNGNVGTSNSYFLELIKSCRLPPSLIKKLGLEFPPARKYKKYSKVPLDYGTYVEENDPSLEDEVDVRTGHGHQLSDVIVPAKETTKSKNNEDKNMECRPNDETEENPETHANDDDDYCEEWERHEALHNDVTSQERAKERLYEEEIELVWEKGGSGLCFYTDAQFWDQLKGGFDERTADDLDVDMEGYYEEGEGDKDARDLLEMRRSERFRKGLENISVFRRKRSPSPCSSKSVSKLKYKIGEFETHTRGIGRKVMEKQGWKEGSGLGTGSNKGIPEAIECDGQDSKDRRGFGYYGEKIVFAGKPKRPKHSNANNPFGLDEDDRVVIGTIYDKPTELDKEEPLLRSNAPTFIKRYKFVKSASKE